MLTVLHVDFLRLVAAAKVGLKSSQSRNRPLCDHDGDMPNALVFRTAFMAAVVERFPVCPEK